jgi:hypothetical protein
MHGTGGDWIRNGHTVGDGVSGGGIDDDECR